MDADRILMPLLPWVETIQVQHIHVNPPRQPFLQKLIDSANCAAGIQIIDSVGPLDAMGLNICLRRMSCNPQFLSGQHAAMADA
jgi:hypothetical protein